MIEDNFKELINKNNDKYMEEIINENFKVYELNTNMVKGPGGMDYFDEKGIEEFHKIIM